MWQYSELFREKCLHRKIKANRMIEKRTTSCTVRCITIKKELHSKCTANSAAWENTTTLPMTLSGRQVCPLDGSSLEPHWPTACHLWCAFEPSGGAVNPK